MTITALPATVTVSFNYVTSSTGTTTAAADILGTTISGSKTITAGTDSDSIILTIAAGTANGTYNLKVTVTNSTGSGANNKNDNQNGAVVMNVSACTSPAITTQPLGQSITYGNNATFTAAASGTPAPTVQWQVSANGGGTYSNIPGATSTTLSLTKPTVAMSGRLYRAVFTNSCASATSSAAALSVTAKALTVSGITANNKAYDGNSTAALNVGSAALVGVAGGDNVTLNTAGATGAFANKNVGTGKTVTVSGLTLGGADASNYTLTQPTTTADITAQALTGSFTAATRCTTATIRRASLGARWSGRSGATS